MFCACVKLSAVAVDDDLKTTGPQAMLPDPSSISRTIFFVGALFPGSITGRAEGLPRRPSLNALLPVLSNA